MNKKCVMTTLILSMLISLNTNAVPTVFSHQGRILNTDESPVSGVDNMIFKIYTSENGTDFDWSETVSVTFDNGYYSVILGESETIPGSLLENPALYLGVTLADQVEFSPRTRITSAFYAMKAGLVTGGVTTSDGTEVIDDQGNISAITFRLETGANENYILTSDDQGNASWTQMLSPNIIEQDNSSIEVSDTGEDGAISFYTEGTEVMFISPTQQVGIGKEPNYALDVNGTVNASEFLVNGSPITSGLWSTSESNIYYDSGFVGIGTSSPLSELDVVGKGRFSQALLLGEATDDPVGESNYGQLYTKSSVESNIVLLIHSNTSDDSNTFVDSSLRSHTINRFGGTRHRTTTQKFGTSSIYFDGDGDYLIIPDSPDWDFGTGDFTLDFWTKADVAETNRNWISRKSGTDSLWFIRIENTTKLCWAIPPSQAQYQPIHTLGTSEWKHIAVVRNSGTAHIYVNGEEIGSTSDPASYDGDGALVIGARLYSNSIGQFHGGYMDEIRITKGIARWTSNFTPPAGPTTAEGNLTLYYMDDVGNEYKVGLTPMN